MFPAIHPYGASTTQLYVADCLQLKYPRFYRAFAELCHKAGIDFRIIPKTKDIWVRDYMHLQTPDRRFIKFRYDPNYLQGTYAETKSNTELICKELGISTVTSHIVLDGGNLVRTQNRGLMCDKVFDENPKIDRETLIEQLKQLLQLTDLIIVPRQPFDKIGHVDGMARFLNDDTVLINDYSKESKRFQRVFRSSLEQADLNTIEISYNPYNNVNYIDATGTYINYLQMKGVVIAPTFGMASDTDAIKAFKLVFPDMQVFFIDCKEIAVEGGVLNCVSWTIHEPEQRHLHDVP